ncbi:hypothetical protein AGDE_03695 [Angomonas deanei]|uniref:Uncharacterized protein n=1 Tax=Angomonas deanei TaxID=59799 RepID=S9VNB3_9TRYP|nr:hypothetical protein AGDE_12200 [Angomonas deanei]EPY40233.1 hypothetical protein AGDE_03695 [Angomonas deanei]CAD2216589.1 hypothetical protein, conserved [Angomonas deanei]|eukprot:EPY24730.1 hypothetical protein AGDE_12200 [Angomonas deanei]
MKRLLSSSVTLRFLPLLSSPSFSRPATARRFQSSAAFENEGKGENTKEEKTDKKSDALGATNEEEAPKRRNIVVLSNTTKGVYIHPINHIASWYWFITDFHKYFLGIIVFFVGTQVLARYRLAQQNTAAQAQLGENLLDQRTRDLLTDIENLRRKDPLRLESEANTYHAEFWKRRAKQASSERREKRNIEIERGKLQGEARGTDLTEWMGAKEKDEEEREVARRTQDYIQGFHQHLKSKRLI